MKKHHLMFSAVSESVKGQILPILQGSVLGKYVFLFTIAFELGILA